MSASTKKLSWTAYCGAVSYLALSVSSMNEVYAQSPLPPVTVDEPDRQTVRRAPSSTQHRESATSDSARRRPASATCCTRSVSDAGDRRARCAARTVCGWTGRDRRPARIARQSRRHEHAVQPDQLHRKAHPGPAGAHRRRRPAERSVGADRRLDGRQRPGWICTFAASTTTAAIYALNGLYGIAPFYSTGCEFRRARRGAERSERAAQRHAARRRHRRQHEPHHEAGSRLRHHAAHDDLSVEIAVRSARRCERGASASARSSASDSTAATATATRPTTGRPTSSATPCSTWTIAASTCACPPTSAIRPTIFPRRCDFVTIAASNTFVPPPPPAGSNYGMPSWSTWKPKDTFAMMQGEIDMTDSITAYGAFGYHRSTIDFLFTSPIVTNVGGVWETGRRFRSRGIDIYDDARGEAGVRAAVDTGPINHALDRQLFRRRSDHTTFTPQSRPRLVTSESLQSGRSAVPAKLLAAVGQHEIDTKLSSVGLADVMSMFDKRVQFTVGARRQTVGVETGMLYDEHLQVDRRAILRRRSGARPMPCSSSRSRTSRSTPTISKGLKAPEVVVGTTFSNVGDDPSPVSHQAEGSRCQGRHRAGHHHGEPPSRSRVRSLLRPARLPNAPSSRPPASRSIAESR